MFSITNLHIFFNFPILQPIFRTVFSDEEHAVTYQFNRTGDGEIVAIETGAHEAMDNGVRFVTGQRGARKIYCDGFSYICAKASKKRKYWVCAKQRSRNCKARLITDAAETEFILRNQQHIHPREKNNFNEHDKANKSSLSYM